MQHSDSQRIKLTVLYGHPTDPDAFEHYYADTHMPLVRKIQGVRTEAAKVIATPDGSAPTHYRIFEFWFDDMQQMQQVMSSPAFDAGGRPGSRGQASARKRQGR